VTKIKDAKGAEYDFVFDDLNRKISETYPHDQYNVRRTETWHYDAAGNLDLYQSPAGQSKHFSYDERNRLRFAWWDGNVGNHVETRYDKADRVTDIITNGGETVISYGYDDANRKVWEEQTLAGYPTRRVETPRDDDGNREALHVPGQYYISYGYTQRNQLADIFNVCHYTYDPAGNMTGREGRWLYTNAANFDYDSVNRMTQAEQGGANGWIFARSHYQYDSNSREVATWRDEEGGKGERFAYDPTNQLKKVNYNADQVWATENPANGTRTVDYTYTADRLNRQSVNDNGAVTEYGFSGMNQYTYVTGQGAHYDNNFNLWFLNGGYVYYDADKRVKSISVNAEELLRCTYDGLGRVVRRTESGTTTLFTYDEWNQILEWDEWGNFKAWNIYGARPDEILARNDAVYGATIYKQDKLGNVVALLDGSGNILEKYTYDVFGQPKVTDYYGNDHGGASWYGNRFLFTGREYLAWIACYDYRNRMYRPSLGRFLQTDPKGFDAGDMNLFRYVGDDPVDLSDPMGLESAPARILPDRFWEIAKHFDGASNFQGSFPEFMKRFQPAGNIAFAPVGAQNEGKKSLLAARVKIEHDETFDLTSDELYVAGHRANAKTYRQLEKPEAVIGKEGVIEYTQTVTSRTTFKVPINDGDVAKEWRRVESVRFAVRELRGVAKWEAQKGFRDAEDAKSKIGRATQNEWTKYLLSSSALFEVVGGGR
jgi:RHS repeat-associated protein